MSRGPCGSGRSSLVRSALLAAVLGLFLLWEPAGAYVVPRRGTASVRAQQNPDSVDSAGGLYFNRHLRSRIHRSIRSTRWRRSRLSVNVTAPEGLVSQYDQAVLQCEATGPRTSIIYWLKNGERISQQDAADSLNLVSLDDGDIVETTDLTLTTVKSKLYIDCATADDEAEYTCVATSGDRTGSALLKLQVSRSPNPMAAASVVCRTHAKKSHHLGTPARITMWTHNKLVPMGSSALLVCRAQGSNSGITWINEETQTVISDADSDRIHVRDNGDLEVKNIQWSDMGGYACQAENEAGTDREVAFLYPYAV